MTGDVSGSAVNLMVMDSNDDSGAIHGISEELTLLFVK